MFMAVQPVMALLLLLLLLQPVMAHFYLCWWRLRVWEGSMYFVHPGGWYELLGQWQVDCLDVLFQEEPEMAAYVVGMGQLEQPGGGNFFVAPHLACRKPAMAHQQVSSCSRTCACRRTCRLEWVQACRNASFGNSQWWLQCKTFHGCSGDGLGLQTSKFSPPSQRWLWQMVTKP